MSKGAKIILSIIVVIAVAGGVWWWLMKSGQQTAMNTPTNNTTATNQTQTNTPGSVAANDSSNAGLQASLSNVDGKMNGFSSDNASINQGLNDQPVEQSY
jgi:cytoskeletal protein RodZ